MGRFFVGSLIPGASLRTGLAVTTPFNPEGDWGPAYQLAHPGARNAELACDFHAKVRRPIGGGVIFFYRVTVINFGPVSSSVFIDF
jgi:hypothetical protein